MNGRPAARVAPLGFVAPVWIGFVLLAAVGILHHEMWRDELHAWLVARESQSLGQLLEPLRYGGHPTLWYLCLYALSRFTGDPLAMQLLHLALAAIGALVFLRFAPFPKWYRALFVFGYFPFYEYCIKSRSYVFAVSALFVTCAALRVRRRHPVAIALLLVIMAQGGIFGVIMSLCLAGGLVVEAWRERGRPPAGPAQARIAALGVFVVGIATTVWLLIPAADSGYTDPWYLAIDPARVLLVLSRLGQSHFLELGFTYYRVETGWDGWASLLLLAASLLLFARRPLVLGVYAAGTAGMLGFLYGKYPGLIWHHGHLFLWWIACLWLCACLPPRELAWRPLNAAAAWAERRRALLLVPILLLQLATGMRAYFLDLRKPYSAAKEAAAFVRAHGLDRLTMAGDEDFIVMSVVGYLDPGTRIFYVAGERFGSFILWDRQRLKRPPRGRAPMLRAQRLARERGEDVLYISSYVVPGPLPPFATKLAAFEDRIWPDEKFYLYRLAASGGEDRAGPSPPAP